MCGIVGVVRRRAQRAAPNGADLRRALDDAATRLAGEGSLVERLEGAAEPLERVDAALRGAPGVRAIIGDTGLARAIEERVSALERDIERLELELDVHTGTAFTTAELEAVNAALVRARDAAWAVRRDRL